jgi:hypothetical protein
MHKIGSAFIGMSMVVSSVAWAQAPLAVGKPAGVHQAQMTNTEYMVFGGIAALGAGILIATSGGRSSSPGAQSVVVSAPATTTV